MACTKEELKSRVESMPVSVDGKVRFSSELRGEILKYSHEQQTVGRSQQSIADDIGLNAWTLNRWHQNERKQAAGVASAFIDVTPRRGRPPKLAPKSMPPAFKVVCPSGFEVRVPARFEVQGLRELLAVLEGN